MAPLSLEFAGRPKLTPENCPKELFWCNVLKPHTHGVGCPGACPTQTTQVRSWRRSPAQRPFFFRYPLARTAKTDPWEVPRCHPFSPFPAQPGWCFSIFDFSVFYFWFWSISSIFVCFVLKDCLTGVKLLFEHVPQSCLKSPLQAQP